MKYFCAFMLTILVFGSAAYTREDQVSGLSNVDDRKKEGQSRIEESKADAFKDQFRRYINDGTYLFSFPERINRRGIIITGAFLLSTAAIISFDEDLRDAVQRNRGKGVDRAADFFEPLGRPAINFAECGLLYMAARISHDDYFRETSLLALESLVYAGLTTSVTKVVFGRESPPSSENWGSFFNGDTFFPSGHTSRSFSIATVFAERYKDRIRIVPFIAYGTASLVAVSMVVHDTHWTSDIFAGGALGILFGRTITKLHAAEQRGSSSAITPSLIVGPEGMAVGLRIAFN